MTGRDGVSSTTTRARRARILKIVLRTTYSATVSILSADVKNGEDGALSDYCTEYGVQYA